MIKKMILPSFALAVLFLWAMTPIKVDDQFLYLTFGRIFFRNGGFGFYDPLIFTISDYRWELWHEWLSYIVYYSAYKIGGYNGILILRGFLVVLAGALLLYQGARHRLYSGLTVFLGAAGFLAASPRCFRDRSSFFTEIFCLVLLVVFSQSRDVRPSRIRWFLPFMFLLWVQLHGGFIIGWFIFFLFMATHWLRWDSKNRKAWGWIFGLCIAVTFLNPLLHQGVWWPIRSFVFGDSGILAQVTEFRPTLTSDYLDPVYKMYLVVFLGFGLIVTARASARTNWFGFAAGLLMTYLGLRYSRMVSLSSLGMTVLLMTALSQTSFSFWKPRFARLWPALVLAKLVILFFMSPSTSQGFWNILEGKPFHPSVPQRAVEFLKTRPPGNVFNEWDLGGYLAWELDGRQKIAAHGFVSDPKLVHDKIYQFSVTREGWREIILDGRVRYFFLRRSSFEADRSAAWIKELMGPDWVPIFADPAAVIFEKAIAP